MAGNLPRLIKAVDAFRDADYTMRITFEGLDPVGGSVLVYNGSNRITVPYTMDIASDNEVTIVYDKANLAEIPANTQHYFQLANETVPLGWTINCKIGYGNTADTVSNVTVNVDGTITVVQTPPIAGTPGKSAYQIAVEEGFVGTKDQWLASLKGDQGDSAYDIAIEEGFSGTIDQWLDSLKGEQGDSAYDVAVEDGFSGDETAWLASLKGDDGDSAYEVAVENGFSGTEEEWLDSLVGPPGPGGSGSISMTQAAFKALSSGAAAAIDYIFLTNPNNGKNIPYKYAASSTLTDNGTSCIQNTASGRKYILQADVIYPSLFGATTDTTDVDAATKNIAAFTAAWDYIHNYLGKGTLVGDGGTYKGGFIKITKTEIKAYGNGSCLLDGDAGNGGPVLMYGTGAAQLTDVRIDGWYLKKTNHVTVEENSTVNNAIEIYNISASNISNIVTRNYNAGLYVRDTGVFQQTRRMEVDNLRTYYGNYSIRVPGTARNCGDFTITNCVFQWPKYTQVWINGMDGLNIDNITCFSSGDNTNRATKKNNFYMRFVTYLAMDNIKAFEAGETGMYFERLENATFSNVHVDWCGQRVASNGIHINTVDQDDPGLPVSMSNVFIDTPTLHGIYIEGTATADGGAQMFNIQACINKLGKNDRFYGDSPTYGNQTNPHNITDHYTLYFNSPNQGLRYDIMNDSTKSSYKVNINGSCVEGWEMNTHRKQTKYSRSDDLANDTYREDGQPGWVENLWTYSNALTNAAWTTNFDETGTGGGPTPGGAVLSQVTSLPGPFGVANATTYLLTENVGTTDKFFKRTVATTKTTGAKPFVLSFFVKPKERSCICVALTNSADTAGTSGIRMDFDIGNGVSGGKYKYNSAWMFMGSRMDKYENGWVRVQIAFVTASGSGTIQPIIFLKTNMETQIVTNYTGDGVSGMYFSHMQLHQGNIFLPYSETTASAQAFARVNYLGGGGGSGIATVTSLSKDIVVAGTTDITLFAPPPLPDLQIRENLCPASESLQSTTYWSRSNILPTISTGPHPLGSSGSITKWNLADTANSQKAFFLQTGITKPSAADLWITISIHVKAAELSALTVFARGASSSANGVRAIFDIAAKRWLGFEKLGTFASGADPILWTETCDNGFIRISLSYVDLASQDNIKPYFYLKNSNDMTYQPSFAGATTDGLYVTGVQVSNTAVPIPHSYTNSGVPVTYVNLTRSVVYQSITKSVIPAYADNAAAVAAGLPVGALYRIGADPKVVI